MKIENILSKTSIDNCRQAYLHYLKVAPGDDKVKQFLSRDQVFQSDFDIYLYYPHLFQAYFPDLSTAALNKLSAAGYLYYLSLISLDRLIDTSQQSFDLKNLVIINFCQEECIKLLSTLFNIDHKFWEFWYKRKQEQQKSMLLEKSLTHYAAVSMEKYEKIAIAKSAVAKVAIDTNYLLSKKSDKENYDFIIKTHNLFSIALQIIDDLQDIEEDIQAEQFNIAFSMLQDHCVENKIVIEDLVAKKECKKYLYFSGVYKQVYDLALSYLNKATQLLNNTPESGWKKLVTTYTKGIELKKDRTAGYFKVLRFQKELQERPPTHPAIKLASNELAQAENVFIKKAIDFLLDRWQHSYPDLAHIMYLSQQEGFGREQALYVGDVFQRAIVGDIFCDIRDRWELDLEELLTTEKNYLLSQVNEEEIGAWRYFFHLKEIAPDIDDLGQILQFLVRSNGQEIIEQHCLSPIATCLANNVLENGGIETWIIPREGRTKVQEQQVAFNQERWGTGPDVEVVANFLYALSLYKHDQYKDYILKGIAYLVDQQEAAGFWKSRWYYGPFYASYTCLRLFKRYPEFQKRFPKVLAKTIQMLRSTQRSNGTWGMGKQATDPLNTALALLCLHELDWPADMPANQFLDKTIEYFRNTQLENGSWNAVPFIKPRIDEPYQSVSLTTAYVLKALSKLPIVSTQKHQKTATKEMPI